MRPTTPTITDAASHVPAVAGAGAPMRSSRCFQSPEGDLLFFAGCSEEQIEMPFDYRVVLRVPEDEILVRLRTRTSNPYGRTPAERTQVLADRALVEPLLRRSADLVLSTTAPVAEVADRLLVHIVDRAAG